MRLLTQKHGVKKPEVSELLVRYIDDINHLVCSEDCPDWALHTHYLLCNFCEGGTGGLEAYTVAAAFAAAAGFRQVVDVGCSEAFQSDLFDSAGVNYLGLESMPSARMWTSRYVQTEYPSIGWQHLIESREETLAVSRLCVGYLIVGHPAYEALKRDFDHLLVSAPKNCIAALEGIYGCRGVRIPIGKDGEDYWVYIGTKKECKN